MSEINPNIPSQYITPPENFTNEFSNLNDKQKIKKAAEQFEAFFLEEILKEANKSFASSDDFEENTYKDMFYQNIAQVLAQSGGIGFGKFIEKAVEQEIADKKQVNGKA